MTTLYQVSSSPVDGSQRKPWAQQTAGPQGPWCVLLFAQGPRVGSSSQDPTAVSPHCPTVLLARSAHSSVAPTEKGVSCASRRICSQKRYPPDWGCTRSLGSSPHLVPILLLVSAHLAPTGEGVKLGRAPCPPGATLSSAALLASRWLLGGCQGGPAQTEWPGWGPGDRDLARDSR